VPLVTPTPVSEAVGQVDLTGSWDKGFLIVGTVLAVIEAVGIELCIGLYVRHNRKMEEERRWKRGIRN
jgi:hypothetical protein